MKDMDRRTYLKTIPALAIVALASEAQAAEPWLHYISISLGKRMPSEKVLREQMEGMFEAELNRFREKYPHAKCEANIEFRFYRLDGSRWGYFDKLSVEPKAILQDRRIQMISRAMDYERHRARREGKILDRLDVTHATVRIFFYP